MQGIFNQLLGVHPQALQLQAQRAEILSANIANADTPDYKAQDIDFASILKSQMSGQATDDMHISVSDERHIDFNQFPHNKLYRVPAQPSLDGNTVETHIEKSNFMENALRYQVSTQIIGGKFNGFIKALRGE